MPKKSPYQVAFDTLQKNAKLLENNENMDIDKLSSLVEESINAYHICQERIVAVESALKQSFDGIKNNS